MFLIVGLGNIGGEYDNTRHNIGFMIVDALLKKFNISMCQDKFNAKICDISLNGEKIIFAKPTTYMNNSGLAVSKIKNFYKIENKNITVFHDDLDLELCKVKVKIGGGDAGHNGIKSLDSNIGKDYVRVRFGVGHPQFKNDVVNFVLGKFSEDDLANINASINKIIDNFALLLQDKDKFMNKFYLVK